MKARTSSRNARSSGLKSRSMALFHAVQSLDLRPAGQAGAELRARGLEVVGAGVVGERLGVLVELEHLVSVGVRLAAGQLVHQAARLVGLDLLGQVQEDALELRVL